MNAQKNAFLMERGIIIQRDINELAEKFVNKAPEKVILSSDVYFDLLEFTGLKSQYSDIDSETLVSELIKKDELVFDTGKFQVQIDVDWFSERDSIKMV